MTRMKMKKMKKGEVWVNLGKSWRSCYVQVV